MAQDVNTASGAGRNHLAIVITNATVKLIVAFFFFFLPGNVKYQA